MTKPRVAAVQMAPRLGLVPENLDRILHELRTLKADLIVFPECALSGYAFDSRENALRVAETIPGPSVEKIEKACRQAGVWTIIGVLERTEDALFNAAIIVGPRGLMGVYRKMHLPFLGVDRFTTPGDLGFTPFPTDIGRLGVLICYDLSFPEAARILKLDGAQILCVPTNWPEAAEISCRYSPMVRAQENHVHVVTANRVGEEGGFRFLGRSKICDVNGRVLAEAGPEETIILSELDPEAADQNRVVNIPGRYELDRIAHRRPGHYRRIVE